MPKNKQISILFESSIFKNSTFKEKFVKNVNNIINKIFSHFFYPFAINYLYF